MDSEKKSLLLETSKYMVQVSHCCFILFLFYLFIYLFWPHCRAGGILVPWSGIQPEPPELEMQIPNHWSTMEVPVTAALKVTIRGLELSVEIFTWIQILASKRTVRGAIICKHQILKV